MKPIPVHSCALSIPCLLFFLCDFISSMAAVLYLTQKHCQPRICFNSSSSSCNSRNNTASNVTSYQTILLDESNIAKCERVGGVGLRFSIGEDIILTITINFFHGCVGVGVLVIVIGGGWRGYAGEVISIASANWSRWCRNWNQAGCNCWESGNQEGVLITNHAD